MDWIQNLNKAIRYIESNITENIDSTDISKHVFCSNFHFQRVFSLLTGITLGEYIRFRRLSLAGSELMQKDSKVIDVSMKYGYESPESFTKAFARFHGITPSSAKKEGAQLRYFAPITIKISLEGGSFMDYRIEKKEAFDILAKTATFTQETSTQEVPKYWEAHFKSGDDAIVGGWYGICHDVNEGSFKYSIADPYKPGTEVPERFEKITIPAFTWAIFTCVGPMPHAIQNMWKKIYSEWLPSSEYDLVPGYDVEFYTGPNTQDPDYISEIWIPVTKKNS